MCELAVSGQRGPEGKCTPKVTWTVDNVEVRKRANGRWMRHWPDSQVVVGSIPG